MLAQKGKEWNNYDESQRKFVLKPHTKFQPVMLPAIQNLVAMGLTEGDIGSIVGYQGVNTDDWLKNLKQLHPEVKAASDIGKRISHSNLVAQMYKSAVGYEYTKQKFRRDKETGEMVLFEESLEHQPANAMLAMFLATNLMPDQFKHKMELTKRGTIIDETKELSVDQIERLAGSLLHEAERLKAIDVEIVNKHDTETKALEE